MGIWQNIRKYLKYENQPLSEKNILFPETRGQITIKALKEHLRDIDDIVFKEIDVKKEKVFLIYLSSLIKKETIQEFIFDPLDNSNENDPIKILKSSNMVEKDGLYRLLYDICRGHTALIFTKRNLILKVNTYTPPERNIAPSESETTVLGPNDSFIENIDSNIGLIKKRLSSHFLKTKTFILGTESRNMVAVLYMDNIANPENVQRVLYRLKNIEFQGFWGLAVLKQMLEDKPYSPFPQFGITGRPDNAISALLDGRIVILMDGSPDAAIAPSTFFEMFSSSEDYYNRWTTASLLRFLRFIGFFITIFLTPAYISALTYHPEVLPPTLLTLLFESRVQVPFPPVIEVLLIELVIEILREAGSRMPTKIGQTIGIVGGIVIGTAAVEAGLASNILIVLVAISALLSFLPPNYLMSNGSRFVRYIFIFAAGTYGFFGQMLALTWLFAHLSNMTSLGTPYMTPFIPRESTDLLDSVLRGPIRFFYKRKGVSRAKKSLTRPIDEE